MKIRLILATAVAVSAATLVAGPALAYDRDAYSYGAGHMIERSDIPASLGAFKPGLGFGAYGNVTSLYVCDVPQSDPSTAQVTVKVPGPKFQFGADYQGKGKMDAPSVNVTVNQYASTKAAISTFDTLKKEIKKCTGTGSSSYTGDDGVTNTFSQALTNGVVPAVTTTGVESLFVSNNSLQQSTPGDTKYVNDQYTVFSLIDDVIIQTQYWSNTNTNLTTKQRKAVGQIAFNAETRWLG